MAAMVRTLMLVGDETLRLLGNIRRADPGRPRRRERPAALREAGHDPEVVKAHGSATCPTPLFDRTAGRQAAKRLTGKHDRPGPRTGRRHRRVRLEADRGVGAGAPRGLGPITRGRPAGARLASTRMHAIRQHEFGPAETLRYEEVPDPVPGAEQVRIAVEAAGVHLIDTKIRAGFSGGPLAAAAAADDARPRGRRHRRHARPGRRRALARAPRGRPPRAGQRRLRRARGRARRVAARDPRRPERRGRGGDDRHRPHRDRHPRRRAGSRPTTPCSSPRPRAASAPSSCRRRATPARSPVGVAGGPAKTERVRALGADVAVDYRSPAGPSASASSSATAS